MNDNPVVLEKGKYVLRYDIEMSDKKGINNKGKYIFSLRQPLNKNNPYKFRDLEICLSKKLKVLYIGFCYIDPDTGEEYSEGDCSEGIVPDADLFQEEIDEFMQAAKNYISSLTKR